MTAPTRSPADWMSDPRLNRPLFAVGASVAGAVAILSRNDPAVDWSMIGPTVVVFWLWALIGGFPRWPVYLLGLSVPLVLNIIESEAEVSMFIAVITVTLLARFETIRPLVPVLVGITLLTMAVFVLFVYDDFAAANWTFGLLFGWGAGSMIYSYEQTVGELRRTRGLVADQAAMHERRRIARDVHDLVGHSLSVVMLHVTGARHLIQSDPAEAERALEQAEEAGRQSLAEIRRTVGLLRDDDDLGSAALPSPDLDDLGELVDEFILAGLEISLQVDGPTDEVDPAVGLAGYRIIQEALTNVSRHTFGARVSVLVSVDDQSCDLLVVNSGGEVTDTQVGSGFGLISMRERAKSVNGSLVAGPTSGGWTVDASLPVSPARLAYP